MCWCANFFVSILKTFNILIWQNGILFRTKYEFPGQYQRHTTIWIKPWSRCDLKQINLEYTFTWISQSYHYIMLVNSSCLLICAGIFHVTPIVDVSIERFGKFPFFLSFTTWGTLIWNLRHGKEDFSRPRPFEFLFARSANVFFQENNIGFGQRMGGKCQFLS